VVPPSKHKSGRSYAWADGLAPDQIKMAQAPEWLLERVVQKPRERRNDAPIPVNITEHDKKRAEGMLEKWAVSGSRKRPRARGTQRSTRRAAYHWVRGWSPAASLVRVSQSAGRWSKPRAAVLGSRWKPRARRERALDSTASGPGCDRHPASPC